MAAEPQRAAPYRWREGSCLAGLAIGVAVIYLPGLHSPLLLDDHASIEHNPSLQHWSTALFPPPAAGVGGRPLLNLTFALNAHFGGFHLTNLAIHLLAAWALFALVRASRSDGLVASFFTAALWAAHPLATESVTYLSQRAESLMALWYLLTLLAYARARYVAATLCCLAGMLTKETMVTAPIAVLLYDRGFLSGSFAAAWRAHRKPLLALAATWIPLALLAAGLPQRQVGFATGMPWWRYARAECFAWVHYLRLALWPHPLVFDYGPQAFLTASGLWLRVAALLTLLGITALLWRRKPAAGFCLAAFILILLPTSTVIPIASQPVAESRLYLPLAALAALAACTLIAAFGRRGALVLGVITAALGGAAEQRNEVYTSAERLWRDTIAKAPANSRAYENLGLALQTEAEAMPGLAGAGVADPGGTTPRPVAVRPAAALATAALAAYRHALTLNPHSAETHTNLGSLLAKTGEPAAALAEFESALRIAPDFTAARLNLAILHEAWGNALAAENRSAEAAAQFSASLAADPSRDSAHYDLANALKRLPGREADAASEYEAALRLNPARAETHNNYANLLLAQGRTREAIAHYREALRLKPDFTSARQNLARAVEATPSSLPRPEGGRTPP